MSGVDLARVALRAALEAARKNGGSARTSKPKPRTTSVVRRDRREPMGLGAAIGALMAERVWELPAAGATLRQRWEAIAPEFAGHVVAVGYDVPGRLGRETGTADYRVDLPCGYMHVSVATDGAMALTGPAVITAVGTIRLSRAGDTTI